MSDLLKYKEYLGKVEYAAEDRIFYGTVHGINDTITFEGQSVKELQKAFEESINDYLKTCTELEKEPEKTYKGSFNVRVPSEVHKGIALIAFQNKISLNDLVKKALIYTIENKEAIIALH